MFHTVVHWHKLSQVKNKCILRNLICLLYTSDAADE